MDQKTKVVFLHRKGQTNAGSKIMRCDQLAEMCRRHLGDEFEFYVVAQRPLRGGVAIRRTCKALNDCIVILLKGTASMFGDEGMHELRRSARAVCIDHVDADVAGSFSRYAQVHIGASKVGCRLLQQMLDEFGSEDGNARVMHLTHHSDPRLADMRCSNEKSVRPVYLGHPANVLLPGLVQERVHQLQYDKDSSISDTFAALRNFNLHYCVRPTLRRAKGRLVAKPFTKGFTAAALGAGVITTRSTDDAVHYLGDDYPFLLDGPDEPEIMAVLDKAESLFGTPAWHAMIERMDHVRAASSPEVIMQEMRAILSYVA